jgi:hypothetical protein
MKLYRITNKQQAAKKNWYDNLLDFIPDYCLDVLPWHEYSDGINHIGEPNKQAAVNRVSESLIRSGLAKNKTEARKLFAIEEVKDN